MPQWLNSLRLRLRALTRRRQLEQDLEDEMAFHLVMREERQRQAGVPTDQARVMARRQFGNVGVLKHRARDVWIWPWLQDADQDVRFAARLLYRARSSTLLAVLCLGLGIGANTAIFSVVNALLLRPFPVVESDRLIRISRGQEPPLSLALLRDVGSGTQSLRAVAATLSMESDLAIDGQSQFVAVEVASAHYADVFGVRPSLGRWFVNDREPVAVISDAIWERYFDRRPDVLGRVIQSRDRFVHDRRSRAACIHRRTSTATNRSMGAYRNEVSVYDRRGGPTACANADVLWPSPPGRDRDGRHNGAEHARHSNAWPRRIRAGGNHPAGS